MTTTGYAGGCVLCAPRTASLYRLIAEKGCESHVSWWRRLLDPGRLRGGAGSRYPDRGNFPGGGAAVSGGLPADRVRLRLLSAVKGGSV